MIELNCPVELSADVVMCCLDFDHQKLLLQMSCFLATGRVSYH